MSKLLDTLQDNPRAVVVIDAEDLFEFVKEVYEDAKESAEEKYQTDISKKLLTREEVIKELRVSPSTLWRWDKCGYLKSIHHGSKVMYRLSDIEEMRSR